MSKSYIVEIKVIGEIDGETAKKLWNPDGKPEKEVPFLNELIKGKSIQITREEKVAEDWDSIEILREKSQWTRLELKIKKPVE